jgi:hypothetical protein
MSADVKTFRTTLHSLWESDMESTDQSPVCGAIDENPAHVSARNCEGQCHDTAQQAAVRFGSTDDLDAAIDWLWTDPELRDLPRVHVGHNTMIVPAAAVERFRKQGYHFTEQKVISAGDLASDQINRIRREGGLPTM